MGLLHILYLEKVLKKLLTRCIPIYHAIDIMIKDSIHNNYLISYVPFKSIVNHDFKFISSVCKNTKACHAFNA